MYIMLVKRYRHSIFKVVQFSMFGSIWTSICSVQYVWIDTDQHNYVQFSMFGLIWTSMCRFLLLSWLNRFPQISHMYGFTPVCINTCRFSSCFLPKLFSQNTHGKHFPVGPETK